MIWRILKQADKKCLYKFLYNFGFKGAKSFSLFQKRLKRGEFFPAFHFISVTDDCNLNCQGCWVTGKTKNSRMNPDMLDQIISETKNNGSYFFGILGGEPLMYKPLFDVLKKHPDCYFQLFTNGTLLTRDIAGQLRKMANITPLVSFEGDENVADVRRGGKGVFMKANEAIDNAVGAGLITGVAMSVCKSNLELATSSGFVESMIQKGVAYLWYYIYRPAGENPALELSLSKDEIDRLRIFMVEARARFDIAIIDAYWDGEGNSLCPAISGLSHHINASGYIEPCPVIQFAADRVGHKPLARIYRESLFLKEFKQELSQKTSGCVFMEDPEWVAEFADRHVATDTSGREDEIVRLKKMPKVPSHGSAKRVPEKSKLYRFAKKRAFFGLGSYG
jgi:MoaA/NifB/PqqE/SkfB family radical SAM enzyme